MITGSRRTALALGLTSVLLSGCLVATPADMEVPSPDGQFHLEVSFAGGGLTLRPSLAAEVSLRHASGAESALATLSPVRGMEIVWSGPRALRICAQDAAPPPDGPVTVQTPTGPETFAVSYGCPARASPAQGPQPETN
ncbi:hypothetical protein [Phenylobacterium sp.]|uniref:hypothetical protein n=1 Tax=Phenylobacterium sp. TaxID=1871053 RepID=UPI00272F323E|nr:hypothetical protein [Phenylobacterium sp.]MDP1875260.1 hypothetical protein [Phenylobacterium sp.]MDP3489727.1 hypothetical protein [Phenylobacterium sp.]